MVRKVISLLALSLVVTGSVAAKVRSVIPTVLAEGQTLNLQGTKFDSGSEPLAASIKTVDGTVTDLDVTVVDDLRFKVDIPTVSADTKAVLRISGGNVTAIKPQEYLVLILNEPTAAFVTPVNGDDMVAIPSTVTASTQASSADTATTATSVSGATQSSITSIPAVTTVGATGKTTTFPGVISVSSGIAGTLTTASQPNITTLAGLTSAGTTGTNAVFAGTVQATQGFLGNVTGTTLTATTFNGTALRAIAGVTDVATAKEISDSDTVTISSATLIKVTDADNDDDLALISGGRTGQLLTIIFDDTITVIDDDAPTATNAIDVFDDNNNNSESFASGDVLVLVFDGTAWHEVARSMNATE